MRNVRGFGVIKNVTEGAMYSMSDNEYGVPDDVIINDIKIILWDTVRWIEGVGPKPNINVQRALSSSYNCFIK